jgi:hypothetical protein
MSTASVWSLPFYVHTFILILSQEKANLARIRDNQRRSRARRKEYLQELEARLRQCELHGIEASAEIQMAARKVADENRKLRELLALHGVGADSIEAYLQSSPTGDAQLSIQMPSHSAPVQALQHLLKTRKPCCSESRTELSVHTGGPDSREGSLTSVSTTQSSWDLGRLPMSGALHHTGKAPPHQFMTPNSTTRSPTSSISYHSHHSVPHQQILSSVSLPRNPSPTSGSNQSQMFELDPRLSQSSSPQYITHQSVSEQVQPRDTIQNTYISTTDGPNVNSCVFAADMISSMSGGDPNAVSADLGCLPGMECEVDNHLVFNVMDRYSEPTS